MLLNGLEFTLNSNKFLQKEKIKTEKIFIRLLVRLCFFVWIERSEKKFQLSAHTHTQDSERWQAQQIAWQVRCIGNDGNRSMGRQNGRAAST